MASNISTIPEAPVRSDTKTVFNEKAFSNDAGLDIFTTQVNVVGDEIQAAADTAQTAADTAVDAYDQVRSHELSALAASNLKGAWIELSGAVSVPSVVLFENNYFQMLEFVSHIENDAPQVTNLATYSQEIDDASYTSVGATVADEDISDPNGEITADKLVEDTSTGAHYVSKNFGTYDGMLVLSAYAKADERSDVSMKITITGGQEAKCDFDLSAGTKAGVIIAGANVFDGFADIEPVGNSWYRLTVGCRINISTDIFLQFFLNNGSGFSYTGDGTSGAHLWGVQLENRYRDPNNLFFSSEYLNDTNKWTATLATVTANAFGAPDYSGTADKIVETASAGQHYLQQVGSSTVGKVYTFSCYARAGERYYFDLTISGSGFTNFPIVNVNLQTGQILTEADVDSSSITNVGNGWYRIALTVTAVASTTNNFIVRPRNDSNIISYTGDGTSGLYVWGVTYQEDELTDYRPVPKNQYDDLNLLDSPEDFTSSDWSVIRVSMTGNTTTAPDGSLTADTITEDSSNNTHITTQVATVVTSSTYTFSVFLKPAGRNYARVRMLHAGGDEDYVNVNISDGTVDSASATDSGIIDAGNGWYQVWVTGVNDTDTSSTCQIYLADSPGNTSYQGDGSSGVYVWGARTRLGNFASYISRFKGPFIYIPTTTGAVTQYSPNWYPTLTKRSKIYTAYGNIAIGEALALNGFENANPDGTVTKIGVGVGEGAFEEFIGFAQNSALDGEEVMVDSVGDVNSSQSGLTVSRFYYVDSAGVLQTTANPATNRLAGRAISTTEILIGSVGEEDQI